MYNSFYIISRTYGVSLASGRKEEVTFTLMQPKIRHACIERTLPVSYHAILKPSMYTVTDYSLSVSTARHSIVSIGLCASIT